MEWTNETCLKLIDEYQKRSELWNQRHPFYYRQSRKRAAWEHISQIIGCQVEEARRKMEILQVSFRRERSKLRKRAGTDPNYEPHWFAYQRMKFLGRNRDLDMKTININQGNQERVSEGVILQMDQNHFPSSVTEANILNEIKVEEVDLPLDSSSETDKAVQTNMENQPTNEAVNDECIVFGEFLVKKLQSYDRRVKCIVQYSINKILFQADMGYYNDCTYSSNELR